MQKEIVTITDFKAQISAKYKMLVDEKHLQEKYDNNEKYYKLDRIRHSQQVCSRIDLKVMNEWKK